MPTRTSGGSDDRKPDTAALALSIGAPSMLPDVSTTSMISREPLATGSTEVVFAMPRPRVLECDVAIHPLRSGRNVDAHNPVVFGRVLIVLYRSLDIDKDAAERIHDLLEAAKVDASVVGDP